MESPVGSTVVVPPWDPVTQPSCENCHGLARPVRTKKPADCGMAQLQVSHAVKLRRRLMQLMHDSRLPQAEFSESVLGIDSATLYRYLRGASIPHSKAKQVRSIEHVMRDAQFTVVVYRTGAESIHWNHMLHRRARKTKRPMHLTALDALRDMNA